MLMDFLVVGAARVSAASGTSKGARASGVLADDREEAKASGNVDEYIEAKAKALYGQFFEFQ